MRFLEKAEIAPRFARLGFDGSRRLAAGGFGAAHLKAERFYYDSGRLESGLWTSLAQAIVAEIGAFEECLVWTYDLVWGDRSVEANPPAQWASFRRWREARGETRNLHGAPGFAFSAEDRDDLTATVEFALMLGWDALLTSRSNRPVLHFSHDDAITIFSRGRPTDLVRRFEKLGLRAAG